MVKNKILIIRFSSFGDIAQCLSCVNLLKKRFPDSTLHFLTKPMYSSFVALDSKVDKVIPYNPKKENLWSLSAKIRAENYTHIYDAHSSLRTKLLGTIFLAYWDSNFLRRPKERLKRFLFFKFSINRYDRWPYQGALSYSDPILKKWGEPKKLKPSQRSLKRWIFPNTVSHSFEKESFIVVAPSAAWELKRWPIDYYKKLVTLLPQYKFIFLGGKEDHFIEEIVKISPSNCLNMAGKLSFSESAYLVFMGNLTLSGDTGILHVADLFKKPALAILGPSAFGFPSAKTTETLYLGLKCSPCTKDGRGTCSQKINKQCLVEIVPETVAIKIKEMMKKLSAN